MKKAAAGCLVALALFALLEASLRLAGFRFVPPRSGTAGLADPIFTREGEVLTTRPEYQTAVQPQRLRLEEGGRDFRIAVLGGSSVHNLQSLEVLRTLLHAHTSRFLPVINAGAVSYGSVRELYHLPEVLSYRPDVLILYTGHNEFEENLLNELRLSTAPLHPLDLWLSGNLRLYQGVSFLAQQAGGALVKRELLSPQVDPSRRMQWHPLHDKHKVHALYKSNLEAMVALAKQRGVPVILGTVAYNRRLAPFSAGEGNEWKEGEQLFARGKFGEAKRAFELGLDHDESPHRASETTNRIVREVAAATGASLLDIDAEIVKLAPHGIPGPELFDDHCHLNRRPGNVMLQRLFAARILELGLLGSGR